MEYWVRSLGISLTIIFGGGFLIRFVRDSDFYIAEFIGGIIGIIFLVIAKFNKDNLKSDDNSLLVNGAIQKEGEDPFFVEFIEIAGNIGG